MNNFSLIYLLIQDLKKKKKKKKKEAKLRLVKENGV